jgi:predicted DNA-binding protein YlxM (UPF0122 family)
MKTKNENDKIIIDNWNSDLSLEQIAKMVGVSERAIRRAGTRLNLTPRSMLSKPKDLIQSRREMYSKKDEKQQTEKAIKRLIQENDDLKKEIEAVLNTKEIHPKEMTYDKAVYVGAATATSTLHAWVGGYKST